MQNLTLAKQMYPGQTYFFLNQYEESVKRPFGYLLIDLETILPKIIAHCEKTSCPVKRALTKQGIKKIFLKSFQNNSPVPLLPAMQEIHGNMDDVLSGNDLRDEEKDQRYCKTDIWLYLS